MQAPGMFELSQLRCFVALAEELHFGRAAARLNMTQSPLSRQLQNLEHVVGVELVERSRRMVRLTPAGKAFVVDARIILRASEEATLTARRVERDAIETRCQLVMQSMHRVMLSTP